MRFQIVKFSTIMRSYEVFILYKIYRTNENNRSLYFSIFLQIWAVYSLLISILSKQESNCYYQNSYKIRVQNSAINIIQKWRYVSCKVSTPNEQQFVSLGINNIILTFIFFIHLK